MTSDKYSKFSGFSYNANSQNQNRDTFLCPCFSACKQHVNKLYENLFCFLFSIFLVFNLSCFNSSLFSHRF